jgi:hypothetical protein
MEKWENLKVYRNLPPEEIPICFEEFAQLLLAELYAYGFKLKETKTLKKLYRVNEEFEQSIHLDNSNRWAKNQKDVHIYVCIKPLYSDNKQLYRIFEAFQVDSSFKMFYPITQEFKLLTECISEKIQKYLLPFFDRFSTCQKIVNQNKQLGQYYKIPNTDKVVLNFDLRQLLYDCAFRQRDKNLFYKLNSEYLQERTKVYEQFKNDNDYRAIDLELIDGFKRQRQVFDNDDLYDSEITFQDEKTKKYIESLNKQKPSR